MAKYDDLMDAIGLEAIWCLDAARRRMTREIVSREDWLKLPQMVAALPLRIVLMFRRGVMDVAGPVHQTNRDRNGIVFIRGPSGRPGN